MLHPLKFRPRFVEKMWGGRKLQTVLGKPTPTGKLIGESWEIYDFPPGMVDNSSNWISSEIANGSLAGKSLHWAVSEFGPDLHGNAPLSGPQGQFPILIKFLDAREDLSVQVHPDHAYASANPHAHLKSEAWYVLQSDPGSRLLNGLLSGVGRPQFEAALRRGDVDRLINSIPAREGDCFYLPSGTVHALGAGILVAEVQTPSDTTFRVFDFNRVDPSTGKLRTLHIEQALQCIDFDATNVSDTGPDEPGAPLVTCPYFHFERFDLAPNQVQPLRSGEPSVLIGLTGSAAVRCDASAEIAPLARGEVVLIPSALRGPRIESPGGSACAWLQVTFPAALIVR